MITQNGSDATHIALRSFVAPIGANECRHQSLSQVERKHRPNWTSFEAVLVCVNERLHGIEDAIDVIGNFAHRVS